MARLKIETARIEGDPQSGPAGCPDKERKNGWKESHCRALNQEGHVHFVVTDSASQRHAIRIPYTFLGMGLHRDVLELDNHLNFKLLDGTPDENWTCAAKISYEGEAGQQQPDIDLS